MPEGVEQLLIEVKRRAGIERVLPMAISRDGAPYAPTRPQGMAHEAHQLVFAHTNCLA